MSDPVKHISPFEVFLRRLTNLSGGNRMLFLPRLNIGKHIDFQRFSQVSGGTAFSVLQKILQEKAAMLTPMADPRMPDVSALSSDVKTLKRSADFLFEEGGTKDLHLGWPFVRGKLNDGTLVNCPLLLIPVDILSTEKEWRLIPREGSSISFNKTFLLALAFYNKTPLASTLTDEDFENIDRDSTVFRTALYTLLQSEKLEIHFNADNYRDALGTYPVFSKDEFGKQHQNGQLKLFPNAVLGIFPQADSYLVPDYIQLIEKSKVNDLADFFQSKSTTSVPNPKRNFINEVKEDKLLTPFPADSFQENILKAVKLGHSLVVQGPPGTGKSQLICNLLADALTTRKRVLVVCQKRAALDVVWERMHKGGFADFVALVHDYRNDRREIYDRIETQIERVNEYKTKIASLDAIQLERNFLQASNRIEVATEELEQFRTFLFDASECGMSIKELYLNSNQALLQIVNLKQEFSQFRMDDLSNITSKIKSLGRYMSILERDSNPWRIRKPFVGLSPSALPEIKDFLLEIPEWLMEYQDRVKLGTSTTLDYQQMEIFSKRLDDFLLLRSVLSNAQVFESFVAMYGERPGEADTLWIQNQQRVIDEIFSQEPELSVEAEQLGKFQNALSKALKAKRNLISWIRWTLFSEDKYLIKRALVANNLSGREGLKTLEARLDNRLNLEHNLTKLRVKSWVKNMPLDYSREKFMEWFEGLVLASRCNTLCDNIRNFKNFLSSQRLNHPDFLKVVELFIEGIQSFQANVGRWSKYFSSRQIEELGMDFSRAETLTQYVQNHFDTMCEYDELLSALHTGEKEVFQKLVEVAGYKATSDELNAIFWNSLALAWIDHIESKHPELRMVSSGKLQQLEQDLEESIALKEKLSAELVQLRAREAVTDNLEYNRLNNLTSYRDLLHEVSKKKKVWPIRKVISSFADELFKVMPIWLVSPESASALFPLEQFFDLVIFDEASQCFSERGIPAMARGKQIVVAGDHQQLRPGDFFQTRWEEETEEVDVEVESLLELASRHLLTLTLQGHYRSRSPRLVEFSNHNFYNDKLEILPERSWVNSAEPVIQYLKVDGIWKEQTNQVEADKIANLIFDLSEKHPKKELGVITFNQPQRLLVLDAIESKFADVGKAIPPRLLVKNIENVQGDERDVIIFSVGYAPDAKGKMGVHFGSLNASGGENRLNVAVTRARERILVVTSISPDQLKVDDTKNAGPKLLKAYLQFALQVSEGKSEQWKAPLAHRKEWYLKYRLPFEHEVYFDIFPNADIAIKNGNGFTNLLLTDDNHYQQALSAKHHHALLPKILEDKQWKFQSIYSRNFWRDRAKFMNEVQKTMSAS
jgi:superfamily I DNA and/or RNA helicase